MNMQPHLPAGYTCRPVQMPDDAPALTALRNTCNLADGSAFMDSVEGTISNYTSPRTHLATGSIIVFAADGTAVAAHKQDFMVGPERLGNERVVAMGMVDPEHRGRGLGRAIISAGIAAAHERLSALHRSMLDIDVFVHEVQPPHVDTEFRLFRRMGFAPIRYYDQLRLLFASRPAATHIPEPPAGYHSMAIDRTDDRLRLLHNACFRDHWGSAPLARDEYLHFMADSDMRIPWSEMLCNAGGEPVAYLLAAEHPADFPFTGRVCWVDLLGTAAAHRNRGLATALIERALSRFAQAGLEGAMIGVDSANPTGAHRLYAELGFSFFERGVRMRLSA